jgi:spore coat polysaccharide biosynthesis protein SpsF
MPVDALAILQVRTTSSRLPGKALLPVAGHPLAALAALRAANRGIRVVIATSSDPSDDQLHGVLTRYGCTVVRGPLEDVLARFVFAIDALPGDAIVVRLTGDNVLPDGSFVAELIRAFQVSQYDYMSTASPQSSLPYGLSAEVFRAKDLREADRSTTSSYDREHVTPWIRRNRTSGIFAPELARPRDFSHLRCTVDDQEDYERVRRVFAGIDNPIAIGWQDLTLRLSDLPGEPRFRIPYSIVGDRVHGEMALGTVQLGMQYGIANQIGKPVHTEAIRIVRTAIMHGVTAIDTARSYEESESVIGEALSGAWRSRAEVITKLALPIPIQSNASAAEIRNCVDASVNRSRQELRTETIPMLLLHSWMHHDAWEGRVWNYLRELRDRGIIGMLGASVYEPQEALAAFQDPNIAHLQIPLNLLDWRWRAAGLEQAAQARPDVLVHARSALLQGLVVLPPERWPRADGWDVADCVKRLEETVFSMKRDSIPDLCFAYVRSQRWIQSVVVGCETMDQLQENLEFFRKPKLTMDECRELDQTFADTPSSLLNPAKWSMK